MNYKHLSDSELENTLQSKVREENILKTQILHLLAEVERRRLYSKNYPSLFEYCIKVLKYSASSAQRRIDTMRALKLMPELETKLQTGELNLTTVSLAQSFFRAEVKSGKTVTIQDKQDILKKLENKSSKETIQTLVKISPQSMSFEKRRDISETRTELKVTLGDKTIKKLDRLKALLSHKYPSLKDSELIDLMTNICLEKLDPVKKMERKMEGNKKTELTLKKDSKLINNGSIILNQNRTLKSRGVKPSEPVSLNRNTNSTSNIKSQFFKNSNLQNYKPTTAAVVKARHKTQPNPRYIPAVIKQEVYMRDKGCCTHVNIKTGETCQSQHFLEYEHIKPLAFGGLTAVSNLRLLCRTHNQYTAIRAFGFQKVSKYIHKR